MKRLFLYIASMICTLASQAGIHTYVSNSALSSGKIVKMRIAESGIYCVTYDEIASAGLNPARVSVLGYGGAMLNQNFSLRKIDDVPSVAIYIERGADGIFNSGDYILFYGQGSVAWNYTYGYYEHTRNPYSDYGYYFLSDAEGLQNEIRQLPEDEELSRENAIRVTDFDDYRLHEQELLNLIDAQKGTEGGGREFYGEKIIPGSTQTFTFDFPYITDAPMSCRVDVAAATNVPGTIATISCGNSEKEIYLGYIESQDFYTKAVPAYTRMANLEANRQPVIRISYNSTNTNNALYVNYIELIAKSSLHLTGSELRFRQSAYTGDSRNSLYLLTGADESVEIWNISHLDSIHRMPTFRKGDTLCMVASNKQPNEYVAVKTQKAQWLRPTIMGSVPTQDLHALQNIDFVIITPAEWKDEAERLGEAHWNKDGLSYAVVTDQEVFNEFSSGTPDASAFRWLMKMLYDRAGEDETLRPKYLLLFGDGTFDNRQLLPYSGKATLLTYQARNSTVETQAYTTDDYFGFLEDTDGLVGTSFVDTYGVMRIGVGRLPVNTREEAQLLTDKIITYMDNANAGKWQQQLCFLADDGDHNQHTRISDNAAEIVRQKAPAFVLNKVYLDAYQQEKTASTESYPLAFNRFTNILNEGVLLMDYSGHGSANNICSEQFLTRSSVEQMTNHNQGFWMLATCSYAHFDKSTPSSAELALLNPKGGAIGVMSACRTVYASDNEVLNTNFCDTILGHKDDFTYTMTLGEAARIAKNLSGKKDNKLAYVLLADPALRLNYPTRHRVHTSQLADTLRALQEVTIQGFIENADGDTAHNFNGKVYVSVYDKLQSVTTRDNDEADEKRKQRYTYQDYTNLLFTGSTNVINGVFEMHFRMPKDIRYNYGNGRVVYYAKDLDTDEDAIGYTHDFIIGGSDSEALLLNDTIGPQLTIYLDNPAFQSGGKTSQTPHFFAHIYDENGINTVGSGIGHDLMLMVDDDPLQTYMLNDYFTAENDNYREGMVSYPMTEQAEGQHYLLFRAWDLLNNSATATLFYSVVKGLSPRLYSVTIAPNPCKAGETLSINISADRPDEQLQTDITIYDIRGERVFTRSYTDERVLQFTPARCNMTGGIYIIRIQTHTSTSGTATYVGKLIVL